MIKKIVIMIIVVFVILAAWQIIEDKVSENRLANGETPMEAFIPTPLTILDTYLNDGGMLLSEASHTLLKALIGFILGAILAVIVASLFLIIPGFRNVVFPVFFAINSFPIIGLAPVIILAFGQGSFTSIVFIALLICYFPILISIDTAFKETDNELIEFMKILNASKWQTLIRIRLPIALPYFYLSFKLAIPASIIGAIIGEWLGSRTGIGQIITIALYQLKPGLLYAALLLIVAISSLVILLLTLSERLLFPWKNKKRDT